MCSQLPSTLDQLGRTYGLCFSQNKPDFIKSVSDKNIPLHTLSAIRDATFKAAQSVNLADRRACIVSRRGTSLNPLSRKLAEDIWTLANCLASNIPVKRTMYRKHQLHDIEAQWNSIPDTEGLPDPTTIIESVSANSVCNRVDDTSGDTMAIQTTDVTDINHSINNDLRLQSDIVNTTLTQGLPIVVNAQCSPNENNSSVVNQLNSLR